MPPATLLPSLENQEESDEEVKHANGIQSEENDPSPTDDPGTYD